MLKDTGERLVLNDNWNIKTKMEHLHRYSAISCWAKDKVVLDAACGSGYGTDILSQRASKVYGIDISVDAIDYCQSNYQGKNVVFEQMSVTKLDFPDNFFDVVVSFETLEHVNSEEQKLFFKEIKRVLKKDGFLCISVPNDDLLRRVTCGKYTNEFHLVDFRLDDFKMLLSSYFVKYHLYYQTVSLSSNIIDANMDNSFSRVIYDRRAINPEEERFYIAVCSDEELGFDVELQSSYRPILKEYYDEHYFKRNAFIYIDTGEGYDGKVSYVSSCHMYDGKNFYYKYCVENERLNVRGIRFDPSEKAGIYSIKQCDVNGIKSNIVPLNSTRSMGEVDIFEEVDPQYEIVCHYDTQIITVEIWGEIIEEIPDYIVWNQVKQKNREYEDKIKEYEDEIRKLSGRIEDYSIILQKLELISNKGESSEERIDAAVERIEEKIGRMYEKEIQEINTAFNQVDKNNSDRLTSSLGKIEKSIGDLDEKVSEVVKSDTELIAPSIRDVKHTLNDIHYIYMNEKKTRKTIKKLEKKPFVDSAILKLYKYSRGSEKRARLFKKIRRVSGKYFPVIANKSDKVICDSKIRQIASGAQGQKNNCGFEYEIKSMVEEPLVSVIVPNYNHAQFLRERLDSIYMQTYKNIEVILLDDCSTDDSIEILDEYAEKYREKTRVCYNEQNVGRVNIQWNKGLSYAKGKYIWIAESDDWCELDFLETMVPLLERRSVMIAFARSVFMKGGSKSWSTEEYLYDVDIDWKSPFVMSAYEAVNRAFAYKNIIPNVSSALFRNIGEIPKDIIDLWNSVKLCGDWIFYLYLIKGGAISYTPNTTNYYRIHEKSTSLKVQKQLDYYRETEKVACYIAENFSVSDGVFEKLYNLLIQHYRDNNDGDESVVGQCFNMKNIEIASKKRIPNVMICDYSMKIGGGEILPIHLANSLRKKGVAVTFVDCNMEESDLKVIDMLDQSVPLFRLSEPIAIDCVPNLFGIEVIHSHNAVIDKLISEYMTDKTIAQIITLHGMYEAIDEKDLKELLPCVCDTTSYFCYIAEKNLVPFTINGYMSRDRFVKVNNGLAKKTLRKIERDSLDIPGDAFVFCTVGRARYDKGWIEAVQAVIDANKYAKKEIHLIMVGDGEAYEEIIRKYRSPFIHAVGSQNNPMDYYMCSDMGLFPTYFAGESVPLVVIESLLCGKPLITTNIGEISSMLDDGNGNIAGNIIELLEGKPSVEELSKQIIRVVDDKEYYEELVEYAIQAAEKFDINNVTDSYIDIYKKAHLEK